MGEPATFWLTVDSAIRVTTLGGLPSATPWETPEAFLQSVYAEQQPWITEGLDRLLSFRRERR
jgi:hypothetical protein